MKRDIILRQNSGSCDTCNGFLNISHWFNPYRANHFYQSTISIKSVIYGTSGRKCHGFVIPRIPLFSSCFFRHPENLETNLRQIWVAHA